MTGVRARSDPPVVVVTGASRGVGAAAATWLARAGAAVTVVARSADDLARTAAGVTAAGGAVEVVAADLFSPGAAALVVDRTLARWGGIDALVNNAAVIEPITRVGSVDMDEWERTVTVDLVVPVRLAVAALPALRERGGRLINLTSTAAHLPLAGLSAYCAAKAGLAMVTRVLALEEPAVTSIAVQPGPVDTGMHVSLRADNDALDPDRAAYYRQLPAAGALRPPDVPGRALAWLALAAPPAWSGREMEHDDDDIVVPSQALLGPVDTEKQ